MPLANKNGTGETLDWNGSAGQGWVASQDLIDQALAPLEAPLVDAAVETRPAHVLDIGCGTGGTTIAVARQLGPGAACVGIDIAAPMIAAAEARAARDDVPVSFIRSDAQSYPFAPARYDLLLSRFGVMFFDDPVRAFANLCRASAPGGALQFITWRSAEENPFMTAAERAAAPLMPELPARRADGPGQFAFADRDHVAGILAAGGWSGIDIRPIGMPCTLPERDLDMYLTLLGPVGRALPQIDEPRRAKIMRRVRAAFDRYIDGPTVRFTAACWLVDAKASAQRR